MPLPKAELHVHLEGTLEPDLVFRLAARNNVELPFDSPDSLRRAYRFADLQSFLNLYYRCTDVLRQAADFYEACEAYLRRARADGVQRAEIFFDPQAHTGRGIPLQDVLAGLTQSIRGSVQRHGISAGLIPCFLRDRGPADAMSTLTALAEYADQLLGVGLDSAEIGYPPADFAGVYRAAAQLGLHRVAHAGEEGPADYIWQALDELGAERIDHGIRAVDDPALLRRLAAERVPLTVCPLSNVRLRCVPTLADHPLRRLLDAGVPVTINSDDPAYFGGYVEDNYRAAAQALGLTDAQLQDLADTSLRSSFLPGPDAG